MWSQVGLIKHHTNKANGDDGIPVELFEILKDDAVKVLPSICQQIWNTQQWPQDWKRSVFIPIPKKGNAKERASIWGWKSDKAGLKLDIQKTKIMASSPVTSWQIEEEKVETVTDFIFLGSKITADSDRSHELKRWLVLERKVMTNLDGVLKSRDITLPAKVHIVKTMFFQ